MARKKAMPADPIENGFSETSMDDNKQFPDGETPDTPPADETAGGETAPADEAASEDSTVPGGEAMPVLGDGSDFSEEAAPPSDTSGAENDFLISGEHPDDSGFEDTSPAAEAAEPTESGAEFPSNDSDPFPPAEDVAENGAPFGDAAPESDSPEYEALLNEWGAGEHTDASIEEAPLVLDDPLPEAESTSEPTSGILDAEGSVNDPDPAPSEETRRRDRRRLPAEAPISSPAADSRQDRVLTIEARSDVQTADEREAIIWHEIQNAHWTRRILTGILDGVERTESGLTLAVANYKGFRVAIPVKEMMLFSGKVPSGAEFQELMSRMRSILTARLGSEIDFVVKGHENKTRSVVASRRDAMLRKRQAFYLNTNELGKPMIHEGRVVQARVVSVAEKVIRVEVFGVECAIVARGLSRVWVGNASDHYCVGDRILVRVQKITGSTPEELMITADVRSVSNAAAEEDLKKCVVQGRYAGRVTDIRGGVVFVKLNNGVNAIAHSCYDRRTPGKRDDVSFAVTRLDEEQGVAVGSITRIIKQNL